MSQSQFDNCPEPYNGKYRCVWGKSNVTHTEGQMSNGKRVGLWKTYWHTGQIHTKSNYRLGKFHGMRELWFENGLKDAVSQWNMGELTYEKRFYKSGKIKHEKRWDLNGEEDGIHLEYEENGKYLKTTYQNGEALSWQRYNENGQMLSDEKNLGEGKVWSKSYHPNGQLSAEGLNYGVQKLGEWKLYYPNGQLNMVANFFKGVKKGPMKFYHENGQLAMEGSYDVVGFGDEVPVGLHISYYPNGKLMRKQNFNKQGLMIGLQEEYYENGQLRQQTNFTETGISDGTSTEYYPNGQVGRTGKYLNDKQEGTWFVYFENGKISQEITYKQGLIMNFSQYNIQGNKYDTGTLTNGNGTLKMYDQNGNVAQEVEFENGRPKGQ